MKIKYGSDNLNSSAIVSAYIELERDDDDNGYSRYGTLHIEFKGGKYKYYEVPELVFLGMLHDKSPGHYFVDHIKEAKYDFEKID